MAACEPGQMPYRISSDLQALTREDMCQQISNVTQLSYMGLNGLTCQFEAWGGGVGTIVMQQACDAGDYNVGDSPGVPPPASGASAVSVAVTLTAQPVPFTGQRAAADAVVFGACLAFLASVWGAKQLYNLFRTGRDES